MEKFASKNNRISFAILHIPHILMKSVRLTAFYVAIRGGEVGLESCMIDPKRQITQWVHNIIITQWVHMPSPIIQ